MSTDDRTEYLNYLVDTLEFPKDFSQKVLNITDDRNEYMISQNRDIYELLGLVSSIGTEETLKYFESLPDKSMKRSEEWVYNSPTLASERARFHLEKAINRGKAQFQEKSGFRCRKCNSDQVSSTEVQIRSADEPMTNLLMCNNCGTRWRE